MIPFFRAWHKENKELEPVLLICYVNWYVNVLPDRNLEGGNQEEWRFSDIVLMQYSGVDDINGKSIFEGDLIEMVGNKNTVGKYGEVKFVDGQWRIWFSHHKFLLSSGQIKGFKLGIVGNIYQKHEQK